MGKGKDSLTLSYYSCHVMEKKRKEKLPGLFFFFFCFFVYLYRSKVLSPPVSNLYYSIQSKSKNIGGKCAPKNGPRMLRSCVDIYVQD